MYLEASQAEISEKYCCLIEEKRIFSIGEEIYIF